MIGTTSLIFGLDGTRKPTLRDFFDTPNSVLGISPCGPDPDQKEITDARGNALSLYMVFTGKGSLFPGGKKPSIRQDTDGTANTILCVESKLPCPWAKPQDLPFDKDKNFPALDSVVGLAPNGFHAVLCDGSVRGFKFDLDRKTMKLLIMSNDGNEVKIP